ncbi:hypothetical protein [Halobacillus salinus]|nr:hypothetical protein [Halobacillus salinus]
MSLWSITKTIDKWMSRLIGKQEEQTRLLKEMKEMIEADHEKE